MGRASSQGVHLASYFSCKSAHFGVEPRGFEPLTSAVQSQGHNVVVVRWRSQIPAKWRIFLQTCSCLFAVVRVGWCTTGVQEPNRNASSLASLWFLACLGTLLERCNGGPRHTVQRWHGTGFEMLSGGQDLYWEPKGSRRSTGRRGACGRDNARDQTNGVAVIGLPDSVRACLFDLDGVLTRTATVHAAAWKEMFDAYLRERAARTGEEFVPFDSLADYARYVDGKPRYDGVRSFLTARSIELPEGESGDPSGVETIRGLGNRKNELVLRMIREGGVEVYEDAVRYLEAARDVDLRCAVVSSSANTRDVLVTAGMEAGRAGGFACVVGVDRVGQAEALREHGASVVVSDLSELLYDR